MKSKIRKLLPVYWNIHVIQIQTEMNGMQSSTVKGQMIKKSVLK